MFALISNVDSTHGGKAVGLRKLTELGLDVPTAFAVRAMNALDFRIEPAALEEWLTAINSEVVAVRSSAIGEDGQDASFAGLFRSAMPVPKSSVDIAKALGEIASKTNWSAIRTYARLRGAPLKCEAIGFVIQEYVDGLTANIMTLDDKGRRPLSFVVESSRCSMIVSLHAPTSIELGAHMLEVEEAQFVSVLECVARLSDLSKYGADVEIVTTSGQIRYLQWRALAAPLDYPGATTSSTPGPMYV